MLIPEKEFYTQRRLIIYEKRLQNLFSYSSSLFSQGLPFTELLELSSNFYFANRKY